MVEELINQFFTFKTVVSLLLHMTDRDSVKVPAYLFQIRITPTVSIVIKVNLSLNLTDCIGICHSKMYKKMIKFRYLRLNFDGRWLLIISIVDPWYFQVKLLKHQSIIHFWYLETRLRGCIHTVLMTFLG